MSKQKLSIGVDLGGTNIQCGLVNERGQIVHRGSVKTKPENGQAAVADRIAQIISTVAEQGKKKLAELAGVGVGSAGAMDLDKGIVLESPNLRWKNFPLRKELEKRLGVPVVLDNDVNVGAWGEYKAGAGQGFDDLLAVFVGTGIGGGLVLGGKLYQGHHQTAGEIGFITLDADGGLGRRKLEERASRGAIANRLRRLVETNHRDPVLDELTGGDLGKIRSKLLSEAVKRDSVLVKTVLEEAADDVGVAIASAVSLLSLPCVVLGGGLTEALRGWWLDRVRTSFEKNVFPSNLRACKLRISKLHDNAGVIGAALWARQVLDKNDQKDVKLGKK
ncbi:MAG: ROK family protein [Phycisphaeraceae bacterium]|nr:ROK family protein [Phycisphaeraceae bacterium]